MLPSRLLSKRVNPRLASTPIRMPTPISVTPYFKNKLNDITLLSTESHANSDFVSMEGHVVRHDPGSETPSQRVLLFVNSPGLKEYLQAGANPSPYASAMVKPFRCVTT
jgi:hypothetical protein